MTTIKYFLLVSMLALVACDKHVHDNQFDLNDENFTALPPCDVFIYDVIYYPGDGAIIGITFAIGFADSLVQPFYLVHAMNLNDAEVWRYGLSVEPGYEFYGITLYYGDCDPWPVGVYWFELFWGEFCVGACAFQIGMENNKAVVKCNVRRELMRHVDTGSFPSVRN